MMHLPVPAAAWLPLLGCHSALSCSEQPAQTPQQLLPKNQQHTLGSRACTLTDQRESCTSPAQPSHSPRALCMSQAKALLRTPTSSSKQRQRGTKHPKPPKPPHRSPSEMEPRAQLCQRGRSSPPSHPTWGAPVWKPVLLLHSDISITREEERLLLVGVS